MSERYFRVINIKKNLIIITLRYYTNGAIIFENHCSDILIRGIKIVAFKNPGQWKLLHWWEPSLNAPYFADSVHLPQGCETTKSFVTVGHESLFAAILSFWLLIVFNRFVVQLSSLKISGRIELLILKRFFIQEILKTV